MDIIIRGLKDKTVATLDALAAEAGQSREAYLRTRLERIVAEGWTPNRPGTGYRAFATSGGKATMLMFDGGSVSGGASNLAQAEMDAFTKAKFVADAKNGGKWSEARRILEAAGFEVFQV